MARITKSCFFALVLGAAIFAVGGALAGNGMCPLSRQEAGMSGGECCWCDFSDTGECDYDTNGSCESNDSCSSQSVEDCASHTQINHEAGHEYYCDDETNDHCKAYTHREELQPCAYEYSCYVSQGSCKRETCGTAVNDRKGCSYHAPPD